MCGRPSQINSGVFGPKSAHPEHPKTPSYSGPSIAMLGATRRLFATSLIRRPAALPARGMEEFFPSAAEVKAGPAQKAGVCLVGWLGSLRG